jgi:phosphate transport system substrate-binding protein
MSKKIYIVPFILLISVFFFSSCEEKKFTPERGEAAIAADESLFRVTEAAKNEFEKMYVNAKLNLSKAAAREGIPQLFEGKIQLFVCGRGLNNEELEFINKNNKRDVIKQFKFCYDGVVLLVKKNDPRVNISLKDLKNMLKGSDRSYKIFMPPFKSSTYEYIKSAVLDGKDPANVKLLDNESDVLTEVKKNPKSLGLLGLNVVADSSEYKFLKVCSDETTSGGPEYFEPHQGFLINGSYPLSKLCYVFINEVYTGVAGGFATFLTGNEGQQIVLKQKLGPAAVPVNLKHK